MKNMQKRLIDIEEAKKSMFERALQSHAMEQDGNVKFCLDVIRMLERLWEEQNEES